MTKPAAMPLALGTVLTVASFALLMTAGYLGLTNPTQYLDDPRPGVPFAVAGWVLLVVGLLLVFVGALRLVGRGDVPGYSSEPAPISSDEVARQAAARAALAEESR